MAAVKKTRNLEREKTPPARFFQATSTNTCGFFAAIVSRVRAAPEGARRPCSQSCRVRTDMPSSWAKRAWVRPVLFLVLATSGTLITRPYSPRLISRRLCRISVPMSRALLPILNLFADLPQDVSGNVVFDILWVHGQHPDHALLSFRVVNYAITTAFSPAWRWPTQLADSTGAGDNISSLRLSDQ